MSTIIILIITTILVGTDTIMESSDNNDTSVLNKIDSPAYNQNKVDDLEKSKNIATGYQQKSKQWFQGGNLHNATTSEWKNASYQNKLATASDWLAVSGHMKVQRYF